MTTDLKAVTRELLAARPDLVLLYAFGSVPRGDARPDSDLDLAIWLDDALEPLDRLDLMRRVAGVAHREVDLVDLRRAPVVLRVHILDGVVLHSASDFARHSFEAHTLGEYARFNEVRRPILDDVAARGAVLG